MNKLSAGGEPYGSIAGKSQYLGWLARFGRTVGSHVTDAEWSRVLAGVAVSLSEGEGKYDSPGVDRGKSGRIESTLTTVSPYARFKLTERVSAWGLAGWGTGDMTMAPVRTEYRDAARRHRRALLTQDDAGAVHGVAFRGTMRW